MSTGEQLRDDGYRAVLAAGTAPHRTYKQHAQDVLDDLIAAGRPFTASTVHELIPADVQPHSPNLLPALIGSAAARRRIRSVGWINSDRPSRHCSRVRLWVAT